MLCRALLLGSVCLSSCVEYGLGIDQQNYGIDVSLPPKEGGSLIGMPPSDACDEWAPPLNDDIAINDNCTVDPITGPLDAVLEWQILEFANYGEYSQAVMTPLVGDILLVVPTMVGRWVGR